MRSPTKRGFTLIELLVVIAIIAILASILFPVFAKAREKARQTQCTSNIKQLALAVQMYSQDNGSQYPGNDGTGWVSKIAPYLGNSNKMFLCPSDTSGDDNVVSYAMSGLLIRQDKTGVKESQIASPSEVGALCDATPSQAYPSSRVIGGGGQEAIENIGAEPAARHSKGLIVGFVDGHAKYFQGAIDTANEANGAVRALYHALPLGLIDNPVAMLASGTGLAGSGQVIVGGEFAAKPFLMAAAKMYAGGYYSGGFKGQYYTIGRPGANYVWGVGTTAPDQISGSATAYDGVCVIVAKGCKIPGHDGVGAWPSMVNSTYTMGTAMIHALFQTGYSDGTVQVYRMPDSTSTTTYIQNAVSSSHWGIDPIVVGDDAEMVEKVGNDPYGIGYCSTAFADPDRVVILGLAGMSSTGSGDAIFPRKSTKFRWVMPTRAESDWPWKRRLNANIASGDTGPALTLRDALRGGALAQGLYTGALCTWGYWPGDLDW